MSENTADSRPSISIIILIVGLIIVTAAAFFYLVRENGEAVPRPAGTPLPVAHKHVEVSIVYPGASADELDRLWSGWLPNARQPEVIRTVSEQGKLHLYLATSDSVKAVKRSISTSPNMPVDVTGVSATPLPNGLPPKPVVAQVPQLVVDIKASEAAALGVSIADINRVLQGHGRTTADVEAIRNTTVKTSSGAQVKLGQITEIKRATGPSHIVRDVRD